MINFFKKYWAIITIISVAVLLVAVVLFSNSPGIGASISQSRVINFLSQLRDVAISNPADTQVLTYDSSSGRWINASSTGGGGGFANPATEDLDMGGNDITNAALVSSTLFTSGAGSVTAPAYARSADLNTGLYFPSADEVAWTAGGTQIATANATRFQMGGTGGAYLKRNVGTYAAPTFAFAGNTGEGMGSLSSDNLFFSVLGSKVMEFTSTTASIDLGANGMITASTSIKMLNGFQIVTASPNDTTGTSTISNAQLFHICNTSSGFCDFVLPDNATFPGYYYYIVDGGGNSSVNNVRVLASGSDFFSDGSSVYTIDLNGGYVHLFGVGNGVWFILDNRNS